MPSRFHHIVGLCRAIGVAPAANILLRRLLRINSPVAVRSLGARYYIRPTDSDLFVAAQIFGHREYELAGAITDRLNALAAAWRAQGVTPLVIDGGANVGYSALYFASCFPQADILAVEPDLTTVQILTRNCIDAPAITPVHAALWSHDRGVTLTSSCDSGSWANSVRDFGLTPSATIEQLIAQAGGGRILLLKLDIEGAEREVCAASAEALASAAAIVVEPHDFLMPGAGCLAPLYRALASRQMDTIVTGENIAFIDSRLLAGACLAPAEAAA